MDDRAEHVEIRMDGENGLAMDLPNSHDVCTSLVCKRSKLVQTEKLHLKEYYICSEVIVDLTMVSPELLCSRTYEKYFLVGFDLFVRRRYSLRATAR